MIELGHRLVDLLLPEDARRAGLDAVQFDVTKPAASFAEAEKRLRLKEPVP